MDKGFSENKFGDDLKRLILYLLKIGSVINQGKYVFAQVIMFLPARIFDRCVYGYEGNKWIKHFTCWNQMLCMMFGQLSNRDSLRDLLVCINAHQAKHDHLGLGKSVSHSNLAEANDPPWKKLQKPSPGMKE